MGEIIDLYAYAHDYDGKKERLFMTSEKAFFAWYDRIKATQMESNYNLRMAFDAGYFAAKEEDDE